MYNKFHSDNFHFLVSHYSKLVHMDKVYFHFHLHARRQVHRPRVRRDEGEGNPAHRGAVRQLPPAGIAQAHRAAGLGHGLRAHQGHHRAHAVHGHHARCGAVLGRAPAAGSVHGRVGEGPLRRDAAPEVCAGRLRRAARGRLERPHRLRASGGAAGSARSVGPSGVRLRRAHRGRFGAQGLCRESRPARARVLRRRLHQRSGQVERVKCGACVPTLLLIVACAGWKPFSRTNDLNSFCGKRQQLSFFDYQEVSDDARTASAVWERACPR